MAASRAWHATEARVASTFAAAMAYIACGVIEIRPQCDHHDCDVPVRAHVHVHVVAPAPALTLALALVPLPIEK